MSQWIMSVGLMPMMHYECYIMPSINAVLVAARLWVDLRAEDTLYYAQWPTGLN